MNYALPGADIAEITLLGTGGGYGESCVIHYGNDYWVVVDSCIDPKTKESLPLKYLQDLGVNVSADVKMILCTHWHNDHILGLSQLLEQATSAEFSFAKTLHKRQFLYWVSLDYQKLKDEQSIASTTEFVDCLKIAKQRQTPVVPAYPDRMLIRSASGNASLTSLSPSDYVIEQTDKELGSLISEYGTPARKCVVASPNDRSVVLLVEVGCHKAILGADLEASPDGRKGWLNILDASMAVKGKRASLFKISHHGSENAYHERIWLELLQEKPVAKLTPWNRNNVLPDPRMVDLYVEKTDQLYITSPYAKSVKAKKREPRLAKIIQFFNAKLAEVKFTKGIVQCRINMNDPADHWHIQLDGEAYHINHHIA